MKLISYFKQFVEKNPKLLEIMLIFFLSLTPLLWLKENYIVLGHDSGFRLDPIQHLINLFYSWDPSSNFGADWSLLKGFLITQAPEALFIALTKSFTVGQQLTFIFWFFLMGFSMYVFIDAFFSDKKYWIFRIFGSTFYMFNFFLLQGWFIVERAKFSLFAVLPLGVLLIYKTLTKEYSILKGVILFSLTSFLLNAGGNPTFYGALILIYGITFIYLTAANIRRRGYREIIYSFKIGLFFIIGFLAINAYWILPQIYLFFNHYSSNLLALGGIEGIIEWERVINKNASFINLFRLQGIPDWYNNNFHTYSSLFIKNPFLITFSFVFPLILLFGLLNHQQLSIEKRNNKLIFLIFLFLLFGLPFTAGSHPPFGSIYILFIKHIPGFAVFRSAFYKFGEVLWFSYIFLVGFYLNLLLLKFVKRRKLYILLGVFSFCFLLAYHFPFFNSNFFIWNTPFTTKVKVPSYVNEMADYVNNLPINTRILLLPEANQSVDSYLWGFWSLDSLPRLFTNKSIVVNGVDDQDIISAMYRAIDQNNEQAFLRLTGIAGVNKILWRDDILYSDKKRNGKSFSQVKNNLENFKSIVSEKETGAWRLYSIETNYFLPSFFIPQNFVYLYSSSRKNFSLDFFDKKALWGESAILIADSTVDKKRNLSSLYGMTITEADCILCVPNEMKDMEEKIIIPYVKLLPDSPFYFIIPFRENRTRNLYQNSPTERINFDIATASKRIAEIVQIASRNFNIEASEDLMIKTIEKYKSLIDDAVKQSDSLPEDTKNLALVRMLVYIDLQHKYFSAINNKYGLAEEQLDKLSIFMRNHISNFLNGKIWITSSNRDKIAYLVNLKSEGNYDLTIENSDIRPAKIQIDGEEIQSLSNNYFTAGIHKIGLIYPIPDNLLIDPRKQNWDFDINPNENAQFGIKNFEEKDTYLISFEYRVINGRLNFAVVEDGQISKEKKKKLDSNMWDKFSFVYKQSEGKPFTSIRFFTPNYELHGATFQLRNFKVIKSFTPLVFLSRTSFVADRITPNISFQRINPTKYIVKVEHAVNPYVLSFGESYNAGWKASIVGSRSFSNTSFLSGIFLKPLPEEDHLKINGYANGWYMKQKGDYTVIVEYYPQKVFYVGLLISIVTIFLYAVLYIFKKL